MVTPSRYPERVKRPTKYVAIVLLLSACADTAGTPAITPAPTTTLPETVNLAYAYRPDTTLSYRVNIDQAISIHGEGNAGAIGSGDLPTDGDLATTVETVMTYRAYPGPIDGTTELDVSARFEDVAVSGTMNGESISPGSDDFGVGTIPPIDASFVVDKSGKVVSSSLDGAANMLGGSLGSLQRLGQEFFTRPIGPRFPDRDLSVGDTWTDEDTVDGPGGPITTRSMHTVTGTEVVDGVKTVVIETESEADEFEIDLTQIFKTMFGGFTTDATNPEELDALLAQLEFRIAVAPTRATSTVWFDTAAGLVKKAEISADITVKMTYRGPDESTGEIAGFTMEMGLRQTARFDLESVDETVG